MPLPMARLRGFRVPASPTAVGAESSIDLDQVNEANTVKLRDRRLFSSNCSE